MADKSTSTTPAAQEVTSSGDANKQDMTSSGQVTPSPRGRGTRGRRPRGQPRGRPATSRGRGSLLLDGENPENSFPKVSPKITRGSGANTRTPLRSRRGRLRKRTRYSSESDDEDKESSEMESVLTPPDTTQQKSKANEKDGKINLDGEKEGETEETNEVNESAPIRRRRGRPPGSRNKKTLEAEERGKKRGRTGSDDSDAEKSHEEGATPKTARQYQRKVPKVSTNDTEESNKEDDSQKSTWRLEIEEKGCCICPKCGCSRKTDTGMWNHFNKCDGKTGHGCTQCEARFGTLSGLKYHLMTVHTASPGQDSGMDEKTRLKYILKKVGKLQCKNEGCSSSYTTLHGYEYHVQRCGKSSEERETFPCDQCDKIYRSIVGLRLHVRSIHAPSPEPETAAEGTDSPAGDSGKGAETPGRSKRQAATKALQHLQELVIEGEVKETKQRQKEISVKHLYSTPKLDITPEQTQQWTRDIKDVGSIACPYEGCTKTYCSLIGLKGHISQCEQRPEGIGGTFKCLNCTREFRTASGVEYHIRKIHNDAVSRHQDSGSDDEYSVPNQESSSEDSISDDMEEDEDDSGHGPRTPYKYKSKSRAKYQPLTQAQGWTDSWKKQNHSKEAFPNLRPRKDQFTQLTGDNIQQYTPQTTHSLPITIRHGKKSQETQAETIGLFESLSTRQERSFTFFVGGPVWGAEWCPTAKLHAKQYAAISCHRSMDARHEYDKVYSEPGMIQLWCLGDLENSSSATDVPYLSLGLAHEFGAVWDMKWCPSGAWDPPEWDPPVQGDPDPPQQDPPQQDPPLPDPPAVLPRLGLLAVASSDGRVRIMSVPHPEALQAIREEQGISHHALHHAYLAEPAVQLVINTSGFHGNQPANEHGQCFTVAWQPDEGHRRLAAGFYDGTIGMWDLQSESPLLRVSPSAVPNNRVLDKRLPPPVLNNYLMFSAHDWAVTSVVWSETNSRFLATGSLDRQIKFWDQQSPVSPIQQIRWTAVRTLVWPLHFPGVFAAVDCSCYARSNMRSLHFFFANGQDDNNKTLPITHHSATTWSVSYNPWRNCVASADCAGEVVATVCPLLDPNTNRAFFRIPVYTVDLRPSKGHDPIETSDPNGVPQSKTTHPVLSEQHTVSHNEPIREQGSSAPTNQNSVLTNNTANHGALNRSLNLKRVQNGCENTSDCVELGSDVSKKAKTGAEPEQQESSQDALPQQKCPSALPLQSQEITKKQNSANSESVVCQDQARGQKQGQQKSETLVGNRQEYSRTESELEGQTGNATRKPSQASSNTANDQSHSPLGLSQGAAENTSHDATLSNCTAVSDNSSQQKPKSKPQDNGVPPEDLDAEAKKETEESLERGLKKYSDLLGKYELVFKDTDLSSFDNSRGDPEFLRLRKLDTMKDARPDRITVEAVHKVAWNPNPGCHIWLLSAGLAGIARVHFVKGLQKTSSRR